MRKAVGLNDRDLYADSRRLAADLASRVDPDAAQRIDDVIAGGATSSEILFGLRQELDRLLRPDGASLSDRDAVIELRGAIDAALS